MKEWFCLLCDHLFQDSYGLDHCPQCGGEEIVEVEDTHVEPTEWNNGYYEGDMPTRKHDDEMD